MLFLFSAEQKLGIEPGSTKASVDNYCRANKMQFSVLQLPADGSDVIKKLSHDHCWLTEKPIIVDSAATGSTATGSTAPAPAARRFLQNRGYNSSRRQLLMDPEDYNNPSINPSNIPYDELFQNAWGHKQTWHQMAEFDNSKMIWIGLLLSVLCGMMAYIDFLATFPNFKIITFSKFVKPSNFQAFKPPNYQTFKLSKSSNYQTSKLSNFQSFKS